MGQIGLQHWQHKVRSTNNTKAMIPPRHTIHSLLTSARRKWGIVIVSRRPRTSGITVPVEPAMFEQGAEEVREGEDEKEVPVFLFYTASVVCCWAGDDIRRDTAFFSDLLCSWGFIFSSDGPQMMLQAHEKKPYVRK